MNSNINEVVTKLQKLFPKDPINLRYFGDDLTIEIGTMGIMSTPKLTFSTRTNTLKIGEYYSLVKIQEIIEILAEVNADV
ncbi:hypothetical protein [Limosilactobacillus reuteri]|uniref:hypothetical protein n=1 Tax=Limosilactobacillus reuteri TaxID=1598 RepID=UPI00128E4FB5|nr:hypothetical protein [Limosilactobacillus reuteri]MQB64677.1 hypothetical protein [Limosilactobacillus reuteri]